MLMRPSLALGAAFLLPIAGTAAQGSCPTTATVAEAFGPAMAASEQPRIYSHLVSSDGRELYFFKKTGPLNLEDYRIFRSVREGDGWSTPEQVRLGAEASDLYPALSRDGNRLVFSSYRPVPGDTSNHPNAHLYQSRRTANGWSEPELIPASRIGHYHSGVTLRDDGSLWFKLISPDWRTRQAMTLAWDGNAFARAMTPAPVAPAQAYWQAHQGDSLQVWDAVEGIPGVTLLAVSRRLPGGRAAPSTYFSTTRRDDGSFTPLTPVRSIPGEAPNFAWVSRDGCWLHFTWNYGRLMRVPVALILGG